MRTTALEMGGFVIRFIINKLVSYPSYVVSFLSCSFFTTTGFCIFGE